MIEDFVTNMVQESIVNELAPYIIVGFLSLIMFIGYHVCGRIDATLERKR